MKLRFPATYKSGLNIIDNPWGGCKTMSNTQKSKEQISEVLKDISSQSDLLPENTVPLVRPPFRGAPKIKRIVNG